MRVQALIERYPFDLHAENGLFTERHYVSDTPGRPASGCIYYAVRPGERTAFHTIDCDEYWSFHAGATLELWVIGTDGTLKIRYCGVEEGAEPTVRFAAGEIFASRLPPDAGDSTFLSCITVPRFTYEGFRIYDRETITGLYPETAKFWE